MEVETMYTVEGKNIEDSCNIQRNEKMVLGKDHKSEEQECEDEYGREAGGIPKTSPIQVDI